MVIRRPNLKKPGTASSAKPRTVAKKRPGSSPSKTTRQSSDSGIVKGSAGFQQSRKQQERRQEEYDRKKEKPFAFRITAKDMQERKNEVKLLYLDTEPTFIRLHTVKTGANRFEDEVCIADQGVNCPLCLKTGKEGVWTLMLTALDKRQYRNREGQLVKVSKKLVPVKGKNIAKFERQYKKHGTLRGLAATHVRSGAKEAYIGEDIEFESKLLPERVLTKYGEHAITADYDKAFPILSYEEMNERYADYTDDGGFGGARGGSKKGYGEDDEDGEVSW
jgi:hypothetical protein